MLDPSKIINLLIQYNQEIEDIKWILKVRSSTGPKKVKLFEIAAPKDMERVMQNFWPYTEAELQVIKSRFEERIEFTLTEIDINQIL